jgi:hypothetical protein
MALYDLVDKVIRGTPTDAAAAVETYLQTIVNTKAIYFINVVGDQNFVTYIIFTEA